MKHISTISKAITPAPATSLLVWAQILATLTDAAAAVVAWTEALDLFKNDN